MRALSDTHCGHFQTKRSLMLSAAQDKTPATSGTSSEPPPSPDSRSSCEDGWRPEATVRPPPAGASAPPAAYQPALLVKLAKMVRKRAQQHWCALCSRAMPSRCVLPSVTHCVGRLCHARKHVPQGRLSFRAFRELILRCVGAPHMPACLPRRLDMRERVGDARRAAPGPRAQLGS